MTDSNSKYDMTNLLPESVGVIKSLDGKEIFWNINKGVLSSIEQELFKTGAEIVTLRNNLGSRVEYYRRASGAEIKEDKPVIVYFYKTERRFDALLR